MEAAPVDAAGTTTTESSPEITDKLLSLISNMISSHPLCEKPEQLVPTHDDELAVAPPSVVRRPIAETRWPNDSWEDESRNDVDELDRSTDDDSTVDADKPPRELVLDARVDCKCGQQHDAAQRNPKPKPLAAADDPNCSIS